MKSLIIFIQKNHYLTLFAVCTLCLFTPVDFAQAFLGSLFEWAVFKPLAMLIYGLCMLIGGLFIGLGGLTLDLAIQELVLGMGEFFNGGFGTGIIEMWEIIRDILNIAFIYSFIYLGIKTILNAESSNTQKSLGLLIVAALLINFSLFITSIIIDFSNIAATQVYSHILNNGILPAQSIEINADGNRSDVRSINLDEGSLSGAFLNVANITSWFGGSADVISKLTSLQVIAFGLFMLIFFIFAGFVFFLSAIRLIYRFIALSLYMIFSPVMFLGMILPKFASQSSKWWSGLLRNAFFAPAFLFMIYLSLKLLTSLKEGLGLEAAAYSNLFASGGEMGIDTFTIFMFFAMMIGFLYASVKVGELMSVAGAKTSIKIAGATQGFVYRNTVGAGLNKFGVGGMDRLARAAESGNVAAKIAHGVLGGESSRRGLEKASNYGAGGRGRADTEKMNKERSARAMSGNEANRLRATIKAGISSTATPEQRIAFEQAVSGASVAQLAGHLSDLDPTTESYKKVVRNMTHSQYTKLMDAKEEEFSLQNKTDLQKSRGEQVVEKLTEAPIGSTTAGPSLQQAIEKGATADDLVALGIPKLQENAQYISAAKMDDLKSKLTPTQYGLVNSSRNEKLEEAFRAASSSVFMQSDGTTPKKDNEIARLPSEILTHPNALPHLSGRVLEIILRENYLDQAQRTRIYTHATTPGTTAPASVVSYLSSPAGANFI